MRRTLLAGALAAALAAPVQPGVPASAAPAPRRIVYTGWSSSADFEAGTLQGAAVSRGRVVMDAAPATRRYAGRRYHVGQWVSPWRTPGFGLTELIASWNARTPGNSWIEVVNDPAAPTRAGVRRTYDRGQFEDAWIPTSGGLAYVIHDRAHPLPVTPERNF